MNFNAVTYHKSLGYLELRCKCGCGNCQIEANGNVQSFRSWLKNVRRCTTVQGASGVRTSMSYSSLSRLENVFEKVLASQNGRIIFPHGNLIREGNDSMVVDEPLVNEAIDESFVVDESMTVDEPMVMDEPMDEPMDEAMNEYGEDEDEDEAGEPIQIKRSNLCVFVFVKDAQVVDHPVLPRSLALIRAQQMEACVCSCQQHSLLRTRSLGQFLDQIESETSIVWRRNFAIMHFNEKMQPEGNYYQFIHLGMFEFQI